MNSAMHTLNRQLFSLTACVLLSCGASVYAAPPTPNTNSGAAVDSSEYQTVMKMLGSQMRKNYELIHTWQGEIQRHQKTLFPLPADKSVWQETKEAGHFYLDLADNKMSGRLKAVASPRTVLVLTGKEIERSLSKADKQWVTTPEHWLLFAGNERYGFSEELPAVVGLEDRSNRVVFKRERSKADKFLTVFDPRDVFGNGRRFFWETCESWVKVLSPSPADVGRRSSRDNLSIHKKTDGDHVLYTVKTTFPRSGNLLEVTYDSAVGFNVTRWVQSHGKQMLAERTIRYQKRGKIFVPTHHRYCSYVKDGVNAGQIKLLQEVSFTLTQLNQPIDPVNFTVETFGLKYADLMKDTIEDKLYVYDSSKFVPADDFVVDPSKLQGRDAPDPAATP
ncbi:hypothetical protein Mal52_40350 [Symmachiella dynata]|uniref:Outer membrane lipoprotein-sorting protein n=1 Tax=Symmachiella dynata TaxID=2527995 RepID=A0A517ZSR7_9PLAN|nr:hypothetical protein [Symmachiella dynata]QDU45541.1 hypothetical protein Mal52_40350 [Symmachiella dynata]